MSTKYHSPENNDDLHSAIEYNVGDLNGKFVEGDINEILAEVCGENDGCDWFWIVSLHNGKFALISGGCDYTGWDCQSSIGICEVFNSVDEAVLAAPITDSYSRSIRQNLSKQITGEQPFALYIGEK